MRTVASERPLKADDTIALAPALFWQFHERGLGDDDHAAALGVSHACDQVLTDTNALPLPGNDRLMQMIRLLDVRGELSEDEPPVLAEVEYPDADDPGKMTSGLLMRLTFTGPRDTQRVYLSAQPRASDGAYQVDPQIMVATDYWHSTDHRQIELYDAA